MYLRTMVSLLLLTSMLFLRNLQGQEVAASSLKDNAFVQKYINERQTMVRSLIKILDAAKMRSKEQTNAIDLLGELHAQESIPWLIENIDSVELPMHTEQDIWIATGRRDNNPCVNALVKIGRDASEAALQAIKNAKEKNRRYLLLDVIIRIEGATFAQLRLEREFVLPENTKKQKGILKEVLEERFMWPTFQIVEPATKWPNAAREQFIKGK
jgi:hypothetical protein